MTGITRAVLMWVAVQVLDGHAPPRRAPDARPLPILLIGDSLAVGLAHPLRSLLGSRLHVDATEGTTAYAWSRSTRLQRDLQGAPAGILLISLGTNDSVSQHLVAEWPRSSATIQRLAVAAGWRPIWLRAPRVPLLPTGARYIPWPAPPPQLAGDRIHPTGAGYRAWAGAIATAIDPPGHR